MTRKALFDAIRPFAPGARYTGDHIIAINALADMLGIPLDKAPEGRTVNAKGLALMRSFEGCKLDAYPDPGSRDGNPWTIGWGSTGPGIGKGVRWTQAQADERHKHDVAKFARTVENLVGNAPTTDDQFAAMVCLAYNIGLKAFADSTVLRKHKAGDHDGAAAAFALWVKNDGAVMKGLVRRRAAEAALYQGTA